MQLNKNFRLGEIDIIMDIKMNNEKENEILNQRKNRLEQIKKTNEIFENTKQMIKNGKKEEKDNSRDDEER